MRQKKYKILIADDEYWIREKLRKMIPWSDYALEFLEPAVDGENVLKRIADDKPDILVTDINMPFINGIELMEILQEKHSDIVVFVVSGYDNFEYVKDAFISGAINYLMKPITKIDFVNAIVKALEVIGAREHKQLELQKAASMIEDKEFSGLLEGEKQSSASMSTMNGAIDTAGGTLILLKMHNLRMLVHSADTSKFSLEFKKEIKTIFGADEIIIFNNIYRQNEFIVITNLAQENLKRHIGEINDRLLGVEGLKYTICITKHIYSIEGIHMPYVEAISLLMTRKVGDEGVVIDSENEKCEGQPISCYFTKDNEAFIKLYLERGDIQNIKQMLNKQMGLGRDHIQKLTYLELRQTMKQFIGVLAEYVYGTLNKEKIVEFDNLAEMMEKVIDRLEESMIMEYLDEILDFLMPKQVDTSTNTMKEIVYRVADYIDTHYTEEISLTSLSAKFYVDYTYLSKIFRQELGENLITYLTNKRMDKAKELMDRAEISLADIACMSGYDDYTYFSRVFKKSTGLSPREYRKGEA